MSIVEIKENVFWVGAVDWDIRDFHGYSTEKGTTYNAYLIKDEKTVLFDTVKSGFTDDLIYHIRELVNPEDIDYIHAHGTSTPYNDKIETPAIKNLYDSTMKIQRISSTKTMIGHLTGATGVIEDNDCIKTMVNMQ